MKNIKRKPSRLKGERPRLVFLLFFSLVLGSIVLAPFTVPANSIDGLSGKVGQIDNSKTIGNLNPLAGVVYYIGDMYCDQLSSHSYYLNGNQMAFSARVIGIFAGLFAGMLLAVLLRPRVGFLVLLGIVPMVVDWSMQLTTSYESLNALRLLTGLIAGASISLFISYSIDRRTGTEKAGAGDREVRS